MEWMKRFVPEDVLTILWAVSKRIHWEALKPPD